VVRLRHCRRRRGQRDFPAADFLRNRAQHFCPGHARVSVCGALRTAWIFSLELIVREVAGNSMNLGGVSGRVLWPQDASRVATANNNNSLVLRLTDGGRNFMLSGDIGKKIGACWSPKTRHCQPTF
jgi:hypothetical protein